MSTTQAPAPAIRNAGTAPTTPRKLFVNIPVNDLQRSIVFFESLGFTFNPQFTDATATAMLVGADAYVMLLTKEKFASFSRKPAGDPRMETSALYSLGVESREAVNAMVKQAVAAGGSHALQPQDHGFMYGWSFYDPDGHHWEVFWMDPSAIQE
jgi:predicted lactoylglutathione lyase